MAVSRLRAALGEDGQRVQSVRGAGYRLLPFGAPAGTDLGWGRVDPAARRVTLPDRVVTLTAEQAELLDLLLRHPGRPSARPDLSRKLWGGAAPLARLDLLLHRIRARLEADPAAPRYLISVRDRGIALLDARSGAGPPGVSQAPPPAPDLVGRDSLRDSILETLEHPSAILLHGPPGVGKSALAMAVLSAWWHRRGGRSALKVELQDAPTEEEATTRLASTLSLDSLEAEPALIRALAARGPLLVLLDGELPEILAARLLRWQAAVPTLGLLATARHGAPGWTVWEVPPLSPADARLLFDRIAGSGGPTRERNIDGLCRRLEGNPLAVELVGRAARLRPPNELEGLLAVPLSPLARAWRASLDGLPAAERGAARAASLFRAAFPTADLAKVADLSTADAESLVAQLRDRSILVDGGGCASRLPATARDLLLAELRHAGDLPGSRLRLQEVLLAALDAGLEEVPHEGGPALDRIEARWADLDGALHVGAEGDPDSALRLATLSREAAERVPRSRRRRWAESLAAAAEAPTLDPAVRASCLRAIHALSWDELGREAREALLLRALQGARDGGDTVIAAAIAAELASIVAFSRGVGPARRLLREHPLPGHAAVDERIRRLRHEGRLAGIGGQHRAGQRALQEAVLLAFDHHLPILEARCLVAWGQALSAGSLEPEAETHLRRAIDLCRHHGLPEQEVRATLRLSQHLLRLGLRDDAATLLKEARDAALRAGLTPILEQVASTLGFLHVGQDRLTEARRELDLSVQLSRELGGGRSLYVALCNRGLVLALDGEAKAGRRDLDEALEDPSAPGGWYRALGLSYRVVAETLDPEIRGLAPSTTSALRAADGLDHPDAASLLAVLDHLAALGSGQMEAEEVTAWARSLRCGAEVDGVVRGLLRAARRADATLGG